MLREDLKGKIIIWPIYIDSQASIKEGRKIPMKYAVKNPRVDEIVEAARVLGLDPIVEEKKYPRSWWSQDKRVIVNKVSSKRNILIKISTEIKRRRSRDTR